MTDHYRSLIHEVQLATPEQKARLLAWCRRMGRPERIREGLTRREAEVALAGTLARRC